MKRFTLRVTVGAVVEEDGKILVVREMRKRVRPDSPTIITQPAGHLEDGESIFDALAREVLEETGYAVEPTALIGMYLQRFPENAVVRFSFVCKRVNDERKPIVDPDILEAVWMPVE
jgi:8-oxo-dGTP pyrophosphatase MutT (NUDIX family)